jgi:hypothetical protein
MADAKCDICDEISVAYQSGNVGQNVPVNCSKCGQLYWYRNGARCIVLTDEQYKILKHAFRLGKNAMPPTPSCDWFRAVD